MVSSEDSVLDEVILQVFEEQDDTFHFPVTTQKEARAFVKALHGKGLSYDKLSYEIKEPEQNFGAWRKGISRTGIGNRIIERINRPLQELLLSDGEEEHEEFCDQLSKESYEVLDLTEENHNNSSTDASEAEEPQIKLKSTMETVDGQTKYFDTQLRHDKDVNFEVEETCSSDSSINTKPDDSEKVVVPETPAKQLKETEEHCKTDRTNKSATEGSVAENIIDAADTLIENDDISQNKMDINKVQELKANSGPETNISEKDLVQEEKCDESEEAQNQEFYGVEEESSAEQSKCHLAGQILKGANVSESSPSSSSACDLTDKKANSGSETNISEKDFVQEEKCDEYEEAQNQEFSGFEDESSAEQSKCHLAGKILKGEHISESSPSSSSAFDLTDEVQKQAREISCGQSDASYGNISRIENVKIEQKEDCDIKVGENEIEESFVIDEISKTEIASTSQKMESGATEEKFSENDENSVENNHHKVVNVSLQELSVSDVEGNSSNKELLHLDSGVVEAPIDITLDIISESNSLLDKEQSIIKKTTESGIITNNEVAEKSPSITPESVATSGTRYCEKPDVGNFLESYDSDYDNEVTCDTDSSRVKKNHDRTCLEKTEEMDSDGPGYVYIFTDSSSDENLRVKVGASRFPHKKLKQSLLFNIDMKLVSAVQVSNRHAAKFEIWSKLSEFHLPETVGWFNGSLATILNVLMDTAKLYPTEE